jgi:hypothetical protein
MPETDIETTVKPTENKSVADFECKKNFFVDF